MLWVVVLLVRWARGRLCRWCLHIPGSLNLSMDSQLWLLPVGNAGNILPDGTGLGRKEGVQITL